MSTRLIKTILLRSFTAIALFLCTLLLMLFIAEKIVAALRPPLEKVTSVSDYVQFNISYGLEPKPNITYDEYGYKVRVNSKAMFGPEIELGKKGLRLAYLGDSYSVGPGIDFKENYPYLVTNRIKLENPHVDFLIGGLGGSSPSQQKLIYQSKVAAYKPDVVVYELFDNDIGDDYIFYYSQYVTRLRAYNTIPAPLRDSRLIQQFMLLVANQLEKYYQHKYETTKDIIINDPESVWKQYTKPSLDELLELTKQNQTKFVLIYIPSGWSFADEYDEGKATEKKYVLGKVAKTWAKENNVPFVDMYDEFAKHNTSELNEVYLPAEKGYHLTELGASLVADKTYNLIKSVMGK